LSTVKKDPIVELNKAIAIGFAKSAEEGLTYLKTVKGLESNSIYHAALGDFYVSLKNPSISRRKLCQSHLINSIFIGN
jgi:predicted RNA polymerase sigma factor